MSDTYRKLLAEEIVIGKPIPWDIIDAEGRVLFPRGGVISSSTQLQTLMMRGALVDDRPQQNLASQKRIKVSSKLLDISPFDVIHNIMQRLRHLFHVMETEPVDVELLTRSVASAIIQLYRKDSEPMIAAVRLMHEFEYFLCHPVHSAILAINLATLLKYDHPRMVRLVCAALTQNVSMNALQATLHIQEQRPTDEQMIRIQAHPLETVALLKNAGVTDDVWLNTVLQHHERMDGKGYPHGIKGDELIEEAKIIGLVDRYAAMLSRRAYRIPMETERLIRNLGAGRDTECDGRLTMLLIGSLGVYPPGSFVTLNNREGAIVIRRTQNPKRPIVCSYISPEGEHYKAPITRNLLVTEMNIKGHTSPVPDTSVDLNRFWGYVKN